MKYLILASILLMTMGCDSRKSIDPDIAVLDSYKGKTIKNVWKSQYNVIRIYFDDGSSLVLRSYKYPMYLNEEGI